MDLEQAVCPICEVLETSLLLVERGFNLVKCRRCGLIYLNPRLTIEELNKIYSKDYYENKEGKFGHKDYLENFTRYRDIFDKVFEHRLKQVQRFKANGKLLEVGCAYGFLLDFFRKNGWNVSGVEISKESSSYAREWFGLKVLTDTIEHAPYPDEEFDVVLMLDIIEHLPDPITSLKEVRRIMKPDGILLVQVPYELSHWEKILEALLKGKKPGIASPYDVPAHLYFFTPKTIKKLLEKAGFTIVRRESGSYGQVRNKYSPPKIKGNSIAETVLRILYFKCGLQRILYSCAILINQGNGINIFAKKSEEFESRSALHAG